jgi:shikimate kinase
MKLFLIGLPGSGKSTLGKQLAPRLHLPFLDLDDVIEQNAQQPIRTIFAQRGEDAFRQLERDALQQLTTAQSAFVLATGGGAPCFFDNMAYMKRHGTIVFLDVPVATIVQRLQGAQITDRPLLQGLDQSQLVQEYTTKFKKRLPVYQQAHITIDQDTTLDELVAMLSIRS